MKFESDLSMNKQESSESYGHKYRLKNRRNINNVMLQQKSRRISQTKKLRLVQMVTKENYRIKDAGRILGISYSTAKKIFTNFRIQLRAKKESDTGEQDKHNHAEFIQIQENKQQCLSKLIVISTIAGNAQNVGIWDKPFYKL